MPVPPQSDMLAVPLLGAVQTNQTSCAIAVWLNERHSASFCPCVPVVASELSKMNEPTPEIGSGVAQLSLPFRASVVGTPLGWPCWKPPLHC